MHVEVGGLTIAYECAGTGPPVALAHGFVGDARSTWDSQIEGLADQFTVIAWDAPGAGRTSNPPEGFGMDDYADCLAAFLRALRIRRAHLVGLSFGGALVLSMFSPSAEAERMARFVDSVREFRPDGFRAMARASVEDQSHVLPEIGVPTLLLYADHEVRAPVAVGEAIQAAVRGAELVVLTGPGHVSPVESPDAVTRELRRFLRSVERFPSAQPDPA